MDDESSRLFAEKPQTGRHNSRPQHRHGLGLSCQVVTATRLRAESLEPETFDAALSGSRLLTLHRPSIQPKDEHQANSQQHQTDQL